MKQSLKSQLPILQELIGFETLLASASQFSGQKFIGHIAELSHAEFPPQEPQGAMLTRIYIKGNNALVIIGPEGGFSDQEVKSAVNKNIIPVSLGKSRLRVETAGVVACAILNSLNSN